MRGRGGFMWRNVSLRVGCFLSGSVVLMFGGCDAVNEAVKNAATTHKHKQEASLSVQWWVDREDNLLISDRYRLHVEIHHQEPSAVTGKYIVRAYGDVFGAGGQQNAGIGSNYDESPGGAIPPGDANAYRVFYYINDPALLGDNLPVETVRKSVDMTVEMEFVPAADDPKYQKTVRKLVVSGGAGTLQR